MQPPPPHARCRRGQSSPRWPGQALGWRWGLRSPLSFAPSESLCVTKGGLGKHPRPSSRQKQAGGRPPTHPGTQRYTEESCRFLLGHRLEGTSRSPARGAVSAGRPLAARRPREDAVPGPRTPGCHPWKQAHPSPRARDRHPERPACPARGSSHAGLSLGTRGLRPGPSRPAPAVPRPAPALNGPLSPQAESAPGRQPRRERGGGGVCRRGGAPRKVRGRLPAGGLLRKVRGRLPAGRGPRRPGVRAGGRRHTAGQAREVQGVPPAELASSPQQADRAPCPQPSPT